MFQRRGSKQKEIAPPPVEEPVLPPHKTLSKADSFFKSNFQEESQVIPFSANGELLGLQVVCLLVEGPDVGVVGVGHGVRGDEALLVALAPGHQASDGRGRAQVELEPLVL